MNIFVRPCNFFDRLWPFLLPPKLRFLQCANHSVSPSMDLLAFSRPSVASFPFLKLIAFRLNFVLVTPTHPSGSTPTCVSLKSSAPESPRGTLPDPRRLFYHNLRLVMSLLPTHILSFSLDFLSKLLSTCVLAFLTIIYQTCCCVFVHPACKCIYYRETGAG